jgi:hypothetical protein
MFCYFDRLEKSRYLAREINRMIKLERLVAQISPGRFKINEYAVKGFFVL